MNTFPSRPGDAALGLLQQISLACHRTTRCVTQTYMIGHVYDNINIVFKVAEQIVGQKDSQENGTCATVFPLYGAQPENTQTADYLTSHDAAPGLTVANIALTAEESTVMHRCLQHTILRIIAPHGPLLMHYHLATASICYALNLGQKHCF